MCSPGLPICADPFSSKYGGSINCPLKALQLGIVSVNVDVLFIEGRKTLPSYSLWFQF